MLRFRQLGSDRPALPGMPAWFSRVLQNRGIDTPEKAERYLAPTMDTLTDPFLFPDMNRAVALIREAVTAQDKICVYGDYDVDGVSATSVMLTQLRAMAADVTYRIPRREEGYGMNLTAMEELSAQGVRLLITVDCGITNLEEVKLARKLGMKVIVTDHHEPGEALPQADALLNPKIGYPFPHLCGAGVALKVCQALGGMDAVDRVIDLAAIATIADIVPLVEENRAIVRAGLRKVENTERPGLRALMTLSQTHEHLVAEDVSFRLAPRINAGGRLEDAAQCVEMLTGPAAKAEAIARHLHELNSARQAEERGMIDQAEDQLRTWDFRTHLVVFVSGQEWNRGIIGLAAGRICEKYHFPTIALSDGADGQSVGSCRSIEGVNMHAVLTECARRYRDCNGRELFIRFGGHRMAAGLTIETDLKPELLRLMDLVIRETLEDPACYIPVAEYDCTMPLEQITLDAIDLLEQLEPTGEGNPPPIFRCRAQVQTMRLVGADSSHVSVSLLDGSTIRRGIIFRQPQLAAQGLQDVEALFVPTRNEFRGKVSAEMQIKRMRAADGSVRIPDPDRMTEALTAITVELAEHPRDREPVERITDGALRTMLREDGGRGTLLIGWEKNRAADYAALGCDNCVGSVGDLRGFSSILLAMDAEKLTDCWQRVVLLDGDLLPGLPALIREKCPAVPVYALQANPLLQATLRDMLMDREAIGRLYSTLRTCRAGLRPTPEQLCEQAGISPMRLNAGLAALREAGLITWTPVPFRTELLPITRKLTDEEGPQNSPMMQWLRKACAEG